MEISLLRSSERNSFLFSSMLFDCVSKNEAMYFPLPKSAYDQADTTPLKIDGGHVHFTKRFKYLGSILYSNMKDDD